MTDWSKVKHFRAEEMACRCGCGGNVQPGLIYRLDELRTAYGKPLLVTSGFRCSEWNQKVSTSGATGPHTTGLAADIGISGRDAVLLLQLALNAGFSGIGIQQKGGGRFIHLDLIPDSFNAKRPWIWSY